MVNALLFLRNLIINFGTNALFFETNGRFKRVSSNLININVSIKFFIIACIDYIVLLKIKILLSINYINK